MQVRNTKDLEQELAACAQVEQYLEENAQQMHDRPLAEYLTGLLDERGLKRANVIRESGMNDIYVHQIFSGRRVPSRDKLLCICFGMHLSAKETQDILKRCGFSALYAKKRRDSVILHALYHKMSLIQCNEELYNVGETLLN